MTRHAALKCHAFGRFGFFRFGGLLAEASNRRSRFFGFAFFSRSDCGLSLRGFGAPWCSRGASESGDHSSRSCFGFPPFLCDALAGLRTMLAVDEFDFPAGWLPSFQAVMDFSIRPSGPIVAKKGSTLSGCSSILVWASSIRMAPIWLRSSPPDLHNIGSNQRGSAPDLRPTDTLIQTPSEKSSRGARFSRGVRGSRGPLRSPRCLVVAGSGTGINSSGAERFARCAATNAAATCSAP